MIAMVWVLDVADGEAKRVTDAKAMAVNANLRDAINWFKDGKHLLVKTLPKDRKDLIDGATAIPTGPTVSTADGKKAQNRTYQDLLKNPNDEHNFEQLARSTIMKVALDGEAETFLPTDMYRSISFSPNGKYVMVSHIERPFSYLVPYYRFPTVTTIYDKSGNKVNIVSSIPLIEDLPKGFMATQPGRRSLNWRADSPATLIYAEALDEGDPAKEVEYRDEVFKLPPPFSGKGISVVKTINRYAGIIWGDDETAVVYDRWWDTRNTKTYVFNPSKPDQEARIISDRNYQDRYSSPGNFVTTQNNSGRSVLALQNGYAFLLGDGFSDKGQFPFLDRIKLESGKTNRLYQSKYTDKIEDLRDYDVETNQLLTRVESPDEFPNYAFRNVRSGKVTKITDFANPFAALGKVHKEVISYKREDGLDLSGTLYLPAGYDKKKKEKLPMILWAYPREYKDKASAAQKTSNPNKFTYPYYGSPIYYPRLRGA